MTTNSRLTEGAETLAIALVLVGFLCICLGVVMLFSWPVSVMIIGGMLFVLGWVALT